MTVGWPSNGRRASSISALPAPAAQISAGGTAYSLLPAAGSAAAQASPPHRTPIAGLAIPLLTRTCCYSPATADEPVNPRTVVLPSAWETTAESSLPPCHSLPRPCHRPPPWCSRRDLVNVVNDRHASELDCTSRGRQLGPRPHARKCLHLTSGTHRKGLCISRKNITAADSSNPPAISSHARKCLLITHKKTYSPC